MKAATWQRDEPGKYTTRSARRRGTADGCLANLARMITPRQKANPAGEGNWHPGPYTVSSGYLPAGTPWNFFQCDIDPVAGPGCSTVEACVWAYIRAIAQLPGYHKRELANGGTETVTTSALSRLLRAPNGYQTPSDFLVHLIRSLLYTGNSYWIAQRNDRSEVEALHWTDPQIVPRARSRVEGQVFSEIFYEIGDNPLINMSSLAGRSLVVPARDVLHIKLDTRRNPLIGETWLSALAPEVATHSAIYNASAMFSNNMSRPSGVLTTDLQIKSARRRGPAQPLERAGQGHERGRRSYSDARPEVSADLDFQRGRADRRTAEDDRSSCSG